MWGSVVLDWTDDSPPQTWSRGLYLKNGTTIHPEKKAESQESFLTSSLCCTNNTQSITKSYWFCPLEIYCLICPFFPRHYHHPRGKYIILSSWRFYLSSWVKPLNWFAHSTFPFSKLFSIFYKSNFKYMECTFIMSPSPSRFSPAL